MGYTHYFKDVTSTPQLAQAAREIVNASDVSICGPDGTGMPRISDYEIALNGDANEGGDHETFWLPSAPDGFNFCKTARKPYDEVVGAILIYAICSGSPGSENISSDGTIAEAEWVNSIALYEKCFGRLGEEEFQRLLKQIGRPLVFNEETISWERFNGPMTRDNYEQVVEYLHLYQ